MSRPGTRRGPAVGRFPLLAVGTVLLLAVSSGTGAVWGVFSARTQNAGNELRAAPDFAAPSASASVVQKAEGGVPGFVRQGAGYRVLAAVTDGGNPSSGTASVSAVADGAGTLASLPAGSASVAGVAYNRVSAPTALGTTPAGTYGYRLDLADTAGNTRSQSGFSVVVDNTPPTATDVRGVNRTGGITGRIEAGDQLVLTADEPYEPDSVIAGWTGAATNVVVYVDNQSPRDILTVRNATNTAALALGSVNLGSGSHVSGDRTFGATGTRSTMVHANGTLTVTLGTASGSTFTAGGASLVWTPSATATDRAGNPFAATPRTGSNGAAADF